LDIESNASTLISTEQNKVKYHSSKSEAMYQMADVRHQYSSFH